MKRRAFLQSCIALCAAPAIVRADALMRIIPLETRLLVGIQSINAKAGAIATGTFMFKDAMGVWNPCDGLYTAKDIVGIWDGRMVQTEPYVDFMSALGDLKRKHLQSVNPSSDNADSSVGISRVASLPGRSNIRE